MAVAVEAESADLGRLVELAERLVAAGDAAETRLRVLGGVGVHLRTGEVPEPLRRGYGDLDLAAPARHRRQVAAAMEAVGLEPEKRFNALQGDLRQIWWTPARDLHVDVFLGEFSMCHTLDIQPGLDAPHLALPAADLLLTKLQVVEFNRKDGLDAAALLLTHELRPGEAEGVLDSDRLVAVLGDDWGFFTTFSANLAELPEIAPDLDPRSQGLLGERVAALTETLESAPKSRRFKRRARIGRRVRWYQLPDESL